jgi:hypothetical protein
MKTELTAEEYLVLLDVLHIADVVLSGHRREEDQRSQPHRALIQKLYGLARGEGLDRLMDYDESHKKYVPTGEYEEHSLAHAVLDEFSDHLFWDELISRLAARDAALIAGGMENLNTMSDSDREAVEGPIRQRYIAEFTANSIRNLEVVERFGMAGGMPVKTSD